MLVITYEQLADRINTLMEHFHVDVDSFNPPSSKDEDKIRAMIVLCHAEFENYIENIALDLIDKGQQIWETQHVANKNIASIFLNSEKSDNDDIVNYSTDCIDNFRKDIISKNHGIKSYNITNMYKPLGYKMDALNGDFLSELDSFGSERGRMAHTSACQTQQPLNYDDVVRKITSILNYIREFEEQITEVHINTL